MAKTILYYLPVRARAESICMMAAYGGYALEYRPLPFAEHQERKVAKEWPFSKLPVLDTGAGPAGYIAQSGAINRYVAKHCGLYPEGALAAAQADMLANQALDMSTCNPIANVYTGDKFLEARTEYLAAFPGHAQCLADLLGDKQFFSGAEKPHFGEFMLFHVLDLVTTALDTQALVPFPTLAAWYGRMAGLSEAVKTFLASRAPLRDLPAPPLNSSA